MLFHRPKFGHSFMAQWPHLVNSSHSDQLFLHNRTLGLQSGVHSVLPEKWGPNLYPDGTSVSPTPLSDMEVPLLIHGTDTYFVPGKTMGVTLDTVKKDT